MTEDNFISLEVVNEVNHAQREFKRAKCEMEEVGGDVPSEDKARVADRYVLALRNYADALEVYMKEFREKLLYD